LNEGLALPENLSGLGAIFPDAVELRRGLRTGRRYRETTLDLDSLPREVFGKQPGSAWNGHYGMNCYHPLVVRSEWGDYLGAKLRPGNVHTADGGLAFVLPLLRRARAWAEQVWLRADAGFPEPELLETLEEEGFLYVARLKTNARLERLAAPYLAQPREAAAGEERLWTHELMYQAGSWSRPRRVVLVIVERERAQGELFLEHLAHRRCEVVERLDAEDLPAVRVAQRDPTAGVGEGEGAHRLDADVPQAVGVDQDEPAPVVVHQPERRARRRRRSLGVHGRLVSRRRVPPPAPSGPGGVGNRPPTA